MMLNGFETGDEGMHAFSVGLMMRKDLCIVSYKRGCGCGENCHSQFTEDEYLSCVC